MYGQGYPYIPPIAPLFTHSPKDKPANQLTEHDKELLGSLESERKGIEEEFDMESATFMDHK